jgi:hypothetical protein
MDFAFFIPHTPNPGTPEWRGLLREGRIAETDFSRYNFHTPVCATRSLSARELERFCVRQFFSHFGLKLRRIARILWMGSRRRRRVFFSLNRRGARIFLDVLVNALRKGPGGRPAHCARRPSWYES